MKNIDAIIYSVAPSGGYRLPSIPRFAYTGSSVSSEGFFFISKRNEQAGSFSLSEVGQARLALTAKPG